jgi:iron complex outermembrane receptor protein
MGNPNSSSSSFTLFKRSLLTLALGGVLVGWGTETTAQEDQDEAKTAALEEILVTAERRTASLQEVPAAISAFDSVELERRQAYNVLDAMSNIPNLLVSNNPGQATSTTVFLRGVGSTESIVTLESAVAFYLDDVYLARQGVNNLSLFDVERVEVLRGPQGTLYGRNSNGGAVRVITAKPDDEFMASTELAYGRFDRWSAKGSVNVPITETLFARFNAIVEQGDGYTTNIVTNRDVNGRDNEGFRGALRWLPSDSVTVDLSYDYYDAESDGILGVDLAGITRPLPPNLYVSNSGDEGAFSVGKTDGTTLTIDWAINEGLNLTSITAFRNLYQKWAFDFTDQPVPIFKLWTVNDTDTFTQEIRLSGNAMDDRLKYVVGAYYYDEDSYSFIGDEINLWISNDIRVPLPFFSRFYDVDVESYAAFAQIDYDITDRLTITVGGRFTNDDKSLDIEQYIGATPGFVQPGEGIPGYNTASLEAAGVPMDLSFDDFSGKIGLQYQFSEDVLGYAHLTQGFKSGGWSARTNNPDEFVVFDPENVDTYEAGVRTTVLDGRARLNYIAFYSDYSDFFATATGEGGNFIVSTNDLEIYGFEFDGTARLTNEIDAFASLGWQQGEYKKPDLTVGDEPQRLPEWTLKLGSTWTHELAGGGGAIRATVDFNYISDSFTNLQNTPEGSTGDIKLWNAQVAYEFSGQKHEVFLSCKNCFEEEYVAQSFDFRGIAFIQTYPNDPFTWLVGYRGRW